MKWYFLLRNRQKVQFMYLLSVVAVWSPLGKVYKNEDSKWTWELINISYLFQPENLIFIDKFYLQDMKRDWGKLCKTSRPGEDITKKMSKITQLQYVRLIHVFLAGSLCDNKNLNIFKSVCCLIKTSLSIFNIIRRHNDIWIEFSCSQTVRNWFHYQWCYTNLFDGTVDPHTCTRTTYKGLQFHMKETKNDSFFLKKYCGKFLKSNYITRGRKRLSEIEIFFVVHQKRRRFVHASLGWIFKSIFDYVVKWKLIKGRKSTIQKN